MANESLYQKENIMLSNLARTTCSVQIEMVSMHYYLQIARTVKFLSSISVSQYIVRPEWLEHSAQTGHFIGRILCVLCVCVAVQML